MNNMQQCRCYVQYAINRVAILEFVNGAKHIHCEIQTSQFTLCLSTEYVLISFSLINFKDNFSKEAVKYPCIRHTSPVNAQQLTGSHVIILLFLCLSHLRSASVGSPLSLSVSLSLFTRLKTHLFTKLSLYRLTSFFTTASLDSYRTVSSEQLGLSDFFAPVID